MSEDTEFGSQTRRADAASEDQRRRLELELVKIRSEARAARLDARAAEIELMLRELGDRADEPHASFQVEHRPHQPLWPKLPQLPSPGATVTDDRFADWDELRSVMPTIPEFSEPPEFSEHVEPESGKSGPESVETEPESVESEPPESESEPVESEPVESEPVEPEPAERQAEPARGEEKEEATDAPSDTAVIIATAARNVPVAVDSDAVSIESDSQAIDDSRSSRRKPAAWLVSLVAHVAALLVLAAITLQVHRPRDQVALSASPTEASEVSMETFTIESAEPESEVSEPTPSEAEYDVSPVGELAAVDFAPEAPLAPPSPAESALTSSASQAAMSLKSDSDAKIQFCGVEGGGNHFVYLVDSSGSMGDAFESARSELIRSIEVLKAEQRFYVVFFDAESEYMRLSDAGRDEPRSAYATEANKSALKRWAMRISMDRGKAPYDPLRFALNLKPDVVFLLSDGEFPQGIEDLLKKENKVENLFGDRHPICIVHTIGYHSKEGESRMRRIAQQNEGQYRHIPRP